MEVVRSSVGDLVEQIRAGSREAEAELVRRYSRGVRFLVRDEDLYQDCFKLALEKIRAGEVRDPERLSGYICGLARNLATGQQRSASRSRGRTDATADPVDAAGAPTQLEQLEEREQANLAHQVLALLPSDRDREVLRRFYLAEDDKDDICTKLGVSSLHFNQILFRARERFRKLFMEMQPMDPERTGLS